MTDEKLPPIPIGGMHPSHGRMKQGFSDTSLNGRVVSKGETARFYWWENDRMTYIALAPSHKEWLQVDLPIEIGTPGDVHHWLGHEDTYVCKECGHREKTTGWLHSPKLVQLEECFYCNLWLEKIRGLAVGKSRGVRVIDQDWNCYSFGEEPSEQKLRRDKSLLGYGGARFEFVGIVDNHWITKGEKVVSHNVWYGGVVPERFRDRLPQTHKLIPNPPPKPIDFSAIAQQPVGRHRKLGD